MTETVEARLTTSLLDAPSSNDITITTDNTKYFRLYRFTSDPLESNYTFAAGDTWQWGAAGIEGDASHNLFVARLIYVQNTDGTTDCTISTGISYINSELPTSVTTSGRVGLSGQAFGSCDDGGGDTVQAGDVIVVEFGLYHGSGDLEISGTVYSGGTEGEIAASGDPTADDGGLPGSGYSGWVKLTLANGDIDFLEATPTPTSTPTATPTSTPTSTPTATPTATPTSTPTSTPTATPRFGCCDCGGSDNCIEPNLDWTCDGGCSFVYEGDCVEVP